MPREQEEAYIWAASQGLEDRDVIPEPTMWPEGEPVNPNDLLVDLIAKIDALTAKVEDMETVE